MPIAKQAAAALLKNLPDDCSPEDMQYQLYVSKKIQNGLARAKTEGSLAQSAVEQRLEKWLHK